MSRIITALILLPILIASILIDWLAPLFVALALAAMVAGLYEFWVLSGKRGLKANAGVGFLGAAALFTLFYFDAPATGAFLLVMTLVALAIVVLALEMLKGAPFDKMMGAAGVTLLGVLYVVLL
nr:hypothetical protein [Acidobacteriota bacterium]